MIQQLSGGIWNYTFRIRARFSFGVMSIRIKLTPIAIAILPKCSKFQKKLTIDFIGCMFKTICSGDY